MSTEIRRVIRQKKAKKKGKKLDYRFLALPTPVLNSESFIALSPKATKLLLDIGAQYDGINNGDLQASWGYVAERGWKSRDTLNVAVQELQHYGLIEKTRQGGLNRCSLFALTWLGIDDFDGKLDCDATATGSGLWRTSKKKFRRPEKKTPARKPRELGTPVGLV